MWKEESSRLCPCSIIISASMVAPSSPKMSDKSEKLVCFRYAQRRNKFRCKLNPNSRSCAMLLNVQVMA